MSTQDYPRTRAVPRSAHAHLAEALRPFASRLKSADLGALRPLLWADMTSEYDARFLSEYLEALPFSLSPDFRAAAERWAIDEADHYAGFRVVWNALFPAETAELNHLLENRAGKVDFAPLQRFFVDEFHIACLIAYDELATVRAYRACTSSYALLGSEFVRYVQGVTADEGRHFTSFLAVLRARHGHRFAEAPRVIAALRASEGTPYANTFVFDHDDDVWTDTIFDEAADSLRRRLHL